MFGMSSVWADIVMAQMAMQQFDSQYAARRTDRDKSELTYLRSLLDDEPATQRYQERLRGIERRHHWLLQYYQAEHCWLPAVAKNLRAKYLVKVKALEACA